MASLEESYRAYDIRTIATTVEMHSATFGTKYEMLAINPPFYGTVCRELRVTNTYDGGQSWGAAHVRPINCRES